MAAATLLRSGFLSSVQDLGRGGFRAIGVSPGGALDPNALAVSNLLVGNEISAAGIEATLGRLQLRFDDQRLVAWAGGAFHVSAGGVEVRAGRAAVIPDGEELVMIAPENGARAWLAISGGVDLPMVLGSRSTDLRSHFGGMEGRALRDGDQLPLGEISAAAARIAKTIGAGVADWGAPWEWVQTAPLHPFLRFVRGAEWENFDQDAQRALMHETFRVTSASDRMGVRLEGEILKAREAVDLVSTAVAPGTIQVPPNGQPVLLLGDCQTIGGYRKIAHVISVDLPMAVQLAPGDSVRFAEISLKAAHQLLIDRAHDLERFQIGLTLKLT